MEKEKVKVAITFEYDPSEHGGMPARNFLFHLLNRLNNTEFKIEEVEYKGGIFDATKTKLSEIPLKKVDSVKERDLPKEPGYLKDRTILPEGTNEKVQKKLNEKE